jgi:competence ComEA-like helix-hairpin-helix protein
VQLSRDAHYALVVLFSVLAAVIVARWEGRTHPPLVKAVAPEPARPASTQEGAALRDGRGIDPNRASASELELLPSVGPSLAKRIVAARETGGPFHSPEDLRRVKGIGAKTLEKLKPWLRFDSEKLEHARQSEAALGGGHDPGALPQKPRAHVEAKGPAAVEQKIEPKQHVPGGAHGEPRVVEQP